MTAEPALARDEREASVAKRRRRRRRKLRRITNAVVARVAPPILRGLARTWHVRELGVENRDAAFGQHGCIATLWHGRMLLPMRTYRHRGIRVLVSPSADGSLITTVLARMGYGSVRGSSHRNPAGAVREMLARLEAGDVIAVTPDGPKGPRHAMGGGAAWVAKATGYPILPLGLACDRAWRAKSWDRFTVPKMRAHVAIVYGEPLHVAADADADALARAGATVKARMLAAEEQGFAQLGVERDW